ncbi:MAG: hypothetical protein RMY29_008490 [Nostoc sp. CreGUA01]|nr:hypothetical protein [Nostoc sp. CreGUA01]
MGHGAWGMGHGDEGESNSSFPPSPHPLISPSSFYAQCPMPNAQCPMLIL